MAKIKPGIIRGVKTTAWLVAISLFAVIMFVSSKQYENQICTGIEYEINGLDGHYFIDQSELEHILNSTSNSGIIGNARNHIAFSALENRLIQNPYIQSAEIHLSMQGLLHVEVVQKQPLLRIINKDNVSYYLTESGHEIPLSDKFTPRVIVASGHILSATSDSLTAGKQKQDLLTLANFIESDRFWRSMVDQIYVADDNSVEVITKPGTHNVVIGQVDEKLEQKFQHLKVFYKEVLPKTGWNYYETINLSYKGQIVAVKR